MSPVAAEPLPRWNLSVYFPGPDSPEYDRSFSEFVATISSLEVFFDECGIGENDPRPTDAGVIGFIDRTLLLLNRALAEARLLRSYTSCLVAADSRDLIALDRQSALAGPVSGLTRLQARFAAWIATRDLDAAFDASQDCRAHRFFLERIRENADKLLSGKEEELLADLFDSTVGAWGRLYGRYTSQIKVEDGQGLRSMSEVRAQAYDRDPSKRKEGYEAELKAWEANSLTISAGLNSIKAQTATVSKRRGWPSMLDEAVYGASIQRSTLDAMMSAVTESFPVFRRYLRAKARLLGHSGGLPWYDLFAPVGSAPEWPYERAATFVEDKFAPFSPRLEALAKMSAAESWVDAGPRPGKVDGAFCSGTRGGESRILMNFKPAFGSVTTLAHELGHAYHNLCLADRTEIQRFTPMTLAETASIFCETIVKRAAVSECSPEERTSVLEGSLQGQCQIVVDIASRFLFEQEVVERRSKSELNADELCSVMARAQEATYGDGLHSDYRHPYMWAAKPHYYSARSFYNFPYTFGLLFALGLYDVYERSPDGFLERYDRLLSETGSAPAEDLARRFEIDIGDAVFWRGSLGQIARDVEVFERAAG